MEFRILGPLEVANGDGLLPLAGAKQRALLAILLLSANETVSSDRLIDELWGGQSPESARAALQVRVSQLRKALGAAGASILTRPPGYVLRLEREQLDLYRFERLVGEADAAEPAAAAAKLREALALWRGPPLADLAYESFAQPAIRRLGELRLAALEKRIDADLALGRHADLVGELETLVEEQPLRERLRAQLMLALYRCGRQADALGVYRSARAVLVEQLGIEPSPPLRELEQAILRQDPTVELTATATATATGTAALVGNLPVAPTPFLGRGRELAEVTALLSRTDARLLTLTGAGGSGKTRLALRIAETFVQDYGDGAWFVGFADITDPELISPTICQALGLAEQPGITATQRLQEWFGGRAPLLLLDNLEQLAAGTAILGELLASCPGLTILVTSREPLHLAREQQYEVPVLDRADAIELFTARAHAVAPHLSLDVELTGMICERVDRLPLAIELAAARTKALSQAEILARLERLLPALGAGPRDAPRRHRTLQATIDWSHDLLTDTEQRLFARLGVFAGGFTAAAAETVCGAELDTLEALTDRSLIRFDHGRYWMLQTLREYALDKLEQVGETDALRRRHAGWCAELLRVEAVETLPRYLPEAPPSRLSMLTAERDNFRGALGWAAETGEIESSARLAATLTPWVWTRLGELSEAERWLHIAHEHLSEYPLSLQADVLAAEVRLAWRRGHHETGVVLCEQALAIYRQLDDQQGICREIISRGLFALVRKDLAGQRAAFEEAILYARQHAMPGLLVTALDCLAYCAMAEGNLDEAQAFSEESLTLTLAVDSGFVPVRTLTNLAQIANMQGRYGDAAHFGRQALAIEFETEDWLHCAPVGVAWTLAKQGRHGPAGRLLGAALGFHEKAGAHVPWDFEVCEERTCKILRDHLDEQTVEALLDEGRNTPLEEAVRDALSESPAPIPRPRASAAPQRWTNAYV